MLRAKKKNHDVKKLASFVTIIKKNPTSGIEEKSHTDNSRNKIGKFFVILSDSLGGQIDSPAQLLPRGRRPDF